MQQQFNTEVPAKLIEAVGTYSDAAVVAELVGKKVRYTDGPSKEQALDLADLPAPLRLIMLNHPGYKGAEGQVIHIGENGNIWADFGDDEGVVKSPEGRHVAPLGRVNEPAEHYEIIEG